MLRTLILAALLTGAVFAQQTLADLDKAAKQAVTDKNFDQALEYYRVISEREPKSAEAFFQMGWVYNEQKKFDTAVRWLKKAAELDPQDLRIQSELGFAYGKLNNVEGSLEAFTRATQLKPDSASAWVGLGDANFELKKDSKAASAAYLKAIELGNNSSSTYYRLGWCFNDLNQSDQAAPQLKKAAALEPKSASIWLEWGYSLLKTKQYDGAVEALTRATSLEPKERLGYLYLGRTYLLMKNKAQVKRQIERLKPLDANLARQLDDELKAAGNGK